MSKRKKFIIVSSLLSIGFIGLQNLEDQYKILGIFALGILTVLFFVWSLWGSLKPDAKLLTLILPVFFTFGVGFFWFLLPTNLVIGILVIIFYAIGIYTLSLTANIYTVAAIRTIALLRAARGVGFVLSLVTGFLLFDAILSLRSDIFTVSLSSAVISFLIFLQSFWCVLLGSKLTKNLISLSLVCALVIGEVSFVLYFWPVTVVVGSLFITASCYVLIGLGQAFLEGRLFQQTVREYLTLAAAVFVGMFLTTHWGG